MINNKFFSIIIIILIFLLIINQTNSIDLVDITAKPSCGCDNPYELSNHTFIDKCPNCGHSDCLLDNPKGVPEHELTCKYCNSDFCGVCGKEKYSWSKVYLEEVKL